MTDTLDTPPETSHTPEPWTSNDQAIVQDRHGRIIADCEIIAVSGHSGTPEEEVANARRIVTCINACQGISTEALEQGILGQLRLTLDELVTATEDLLAAIDGATGQFDGEGTKADAACTRARTVLQSADGLSIHELLASRGQVALNWSVEDVLQVRPDLTEEQALKVLKRVESRHDAKIGITWDTLDWVARDLFGSAPDTGEPRTPAKHCGPATCPPIKPTTSTIATERRLPPWSMWLAMQITRSRR